MEIVSLFCCLEVKTMAFYNVKAGAWDHTVIWAAFLWDSLNTFQEVAAYVGDEASWDK